MMQSCSCYHVVGGSCSCGWFHDNENNSFSMLFTEMPNYSQNYFDNTNDIMYSSPSSSSSVDCTLSLGTPSTRLSNNNIININGQINHDKRRSSSSSVSKFSSWDFLKSESTSAHNKNNNRNINSGACDSLSARRCANCDTTCTPLWRNGPKGPKSLCNACGIRYKKEERRASAKAATTTDHSSGGPPPPVVDGHYYYSSYGQNQNLANYYSTSGNEFRFIEEDDVDDRDANGIPFLSWRLNVTDRPALVHDFTR